MDVQTGSLEMETDGRFTTVEAGPRAEVGLTLDEPVPRALGLLDQLGLWGNLGVSLLGFTGAIFVLQPGGSGTPELSVAAAVTAIVVGTILGTAPLALAAVPGADTGAPAMVLLRGVFGARASYVPTVLNVVQCLGWATFEVVTISAAAHTVASGAPRWVYVLAAGALSGAMAMRPLGFIRVLRKYVTIAVVVVLAYLLVELARHPLHHVAGGGWGGFWSATDTVVAVAISFVPLASDYSRHSRSRGASFAGPMVGYGITQTLCYFIGLLCLLTVAKDPSQIYGAFIALPLGSAAFAVLAIRELDQSFADMYSTAVSTQNLRPRWDRRVLAAVIMVIATAAALWLNVSDYENFLYLLGSVFVPLAAVLIVDCFVVSPGRWDLSSGSPSRWSTSVAWAVGFVVYQLINPGYISWWASGWQHVDRAIGFTPETWMSASILSFVASSVATVVLGWSARVLRSGRPTP